MLESLLFERGCAKQARYVSNDVFFVTNWTSSSCLSAPYSGCRLVNYVQHDSGTYSDSLSLELTEIKMLALALTAELEG